MSVPCCCGQPACTNCTGDRPASFEVAVTGISFTGAECAACVDLNAVYVFTDADLIDPCTYKLTLSWSCGDAEAWLYIQNTGTGYRFQFSLVLYGIYQADWYYPNPESGVTLACDAIPLSAMTLGVGPSPCTSASPAATIESV